MLNLIATPRRRATSFSRQLLLRALSAGAAEMALPNLLQASGIRSEAMMEDQQKRLIPVTRGKPIRELFSRHREDSGCLPR
jgi:hypothetical protein